MHGFDHPDLPALRVACETLDGTESYLWVCPVYLSSDRPADSPNQQTIRGSGLAYGANLIVDPESSLLSFSLYRVSCLLRDKETKPYGSQSPNSFLAFQRAAEVVKQLADGTVSFFLSRFRYVVIDIPIQLELDIPKLEAAKSSLVYSQTRNVASPGSAVSKTSRAYSPHCSDVLYRPPRPLSIKHSKEFRKTLVVNN